MLGLTVDGDALSATGAGDQNLYTKVTENCMPGGSIHYRLGLGVRLVKVLERGLSHVTNLFLLLFDLGIGGESCGGQRADQRDSDEPKCVSRFHTHILLWSPRSSKSGRAQRRRWIRTKSISRDSGLRLAEITVWSRIAWSS